MKIRPTYLLILWTCLLAFQISARSQSLQETGKVVLFLPLHLDSIFNGNNKYVYQKSEFPRFVSSPLEFYQGFAEALDSLKLHPGYVDLVVFDTRAKNRSLSSMLQSDSVINAQIWLLYGNVAESRQVADAAKSLQIPLININLPNDGGIQDNPYYFLWNTTLQGQCEAIYRHLQQYYPLERLVLVRKKGSMEDRILGLMEQNGQTTKGSPLKFKTLDVTDSTIKTELVKILDTTKQTILFGASLDEKFARNLAQAGSELREKKYKLELVGMSTWDNIREFSTEPYRNLEITIPTPFYYPKTGNWAKRLKARYEENTYGKISDNYMRGYEIAWFLHPFLQTNNTPLATSLPGKQKFLFAEVNWIPILSPQTGRTNFYDNRKMYFVKRLDGVIRSVR